MTNQGLKLCLLLLCGHLFSCNKSNEKSVSEKIENPLMTYFSSSTNPSDTAYIKKVELHYNRYLHLQQYDSCGKLLVSYGNALYANSMNNPIFKKYSIEYFKKYDSLHAKVLHYALANMLASNYGMEGKADSAKYWYRMGMNNYTETLLQKSNAFACSEVGIIFLSNSQLDSAEYYFIKAIHSFEQINDTANLTSNYINLSTVFQGLHEWNLAENFVDKATKLQKNSKDTDLILACLHMKASIKNEGFSDSVNFIRLIDSSTNLYNQYSHPSLYLQFIQHYMMFEQSLIKNALELATNHFIICDSCNKIMQNEGIQTQIDYMKCILKAANNQSLPDEKKAQEIAGFFESNHGLVFAARLYKALAKNANLKSDFQAAYQYNINYQRCIDNIVRQNSQGQLVEFEKKYQTAKKEKTIAEQHSKILKSKFQITALLLSLIGMAFISIAFFAYKKRKEAQTEIIRQQKFTDELLQNTEDERKRIATNLHDGVNHELLTLKNISSSGKPIATEDIEKVIHEVRQVSRDLYPAMFDNIGLKASIEALCERLTEVGLFTTSEINYQNTLSKRNELQLYRIIQEALNNTLKHAKANAAKVSIDLKDNELWVEIKDNGIGFDTEDKMKSENSFGLQSFLQRARAIGGQTKIESSTNGTKLIFTTPIH